LLYRHCFLPFPSSPSSSLLPIPFVVSCFAEKKGLPFVPPVFITLDPSRDTCGQVGAYVKDFHPKMIGLTGTPGQIAKVAKAFRVYFADVDKAEDSEDYLGE
jgi:protein SCO1/2